MSKKCSLEISLFPPGYQKLNFSTKFLRLSKQKTTVKSNFENCKILAWSTKRHICHLFKFLHRNTFAFNLWNYVPQTELSRWKTKHKCVDFCWKYWNPLKAHPNHCSTNQHRSGYAYARCARESYENLGGSMCNILAFKG